jgi:hypothetical protein
MFPQTTGLFRTTQCCNPEGYILHSECLFHFQDAPAKPVTTVWNYWILVSVISYFFLLCFCSHFVGSACDGWVYILSYVSFLYNNYEVGRQEEVTLQLLLWMGRICVKIMEINQITRGLYVCALNVRSTWNGLQSCTNLHYCHQRRCKRYVGFSW